MKNCKTCGSTKPTGLFGDFGWQKDMRTPKGGYWKSNCKACHAQANVESTITWHIDNPDRAAANFGKAYALRTNPNSVPDDFDLESTIPLYAERNRLTQETGVQHHVDHIVALANGGLHTADNLQILTQEENLKKGNT